MSRKTHPDARAFLGDESMRYFTNGYRHFHFHIKAFTAGVDELQGELEIHYDGPDRPNGKPHLSSIEYTTIASMLAEYALVYLFRLDAEQVGVSLLRHIRLKLRNAIEVDDATTLPFRCALGKSECTRHAANGILSPVRVVLAGTEVALVADHPASRWGRFDPHAAWPLNLPAMHNHGYKLRTNLVEQVHCDTENRVCTARVTRRDDYRGDRRGLFSARETIVPTDVLTVTGQLMQILLYTMEGTDRETCGNIWLRAMDIRYDRPVWDPQYTAKVDFLDVKTLAMGNTSWRTVHLASQLGGISATFDITHQLQK